MSSKRTTRPNGQRQARKTGQFEWVLLGEPAVGKSSLVFRFIQGHFRDQASAIRVAFLTQSVWATPQ